MKSILFSIFISFFSYTIYAQNVEEAKLFPAKAGDHYGFINETGKLIFKAEWDTAQDFSEGFALVEKDGKFGFTNNNGWLVIEAQYGKGTQAFSEDMAAVVVPFNGTGPGGKYGYINKRGKLKINVDFDEGESFSDGRAAVKVGDKWGYIGTNGKYDIAPEFEEARPFVDGLACVKKDGKFGVIKKNRKWLVKPTYEQAGLKYSEGALAVLQDGDWGFLDDKGEWILEPLYRNDVAHAPQYKDGLAPVADRQSGQWGFIDQTGKWMVHPQYDLANEFSDGLAAVKSGDKWGFINRNGQLVIPFKEYTKVGDFENGLCRVTLKGGKNSYINHKGRTVYPRE